MLPLTFENPDDYDKINPDDKVDLLCTELAVGKPITIRFKPKNGTLWETKLVHTFNEGTYSLRTAPETTNLLTSLDQIKWFRNGSALNTMAKNAKAQGEHEY